MINFAEYLPVGKENAISAERLRARIGVKNDREVRQCVGAARLSGQLICSGNAGYYIPATHEKVLPPADRMQKLLERLRS